MLLPFVIPLLIALGAGLLALLPLTVPRARHHVWLFTLLAVMAPLIGFYTGYNRMLPQWWQPFPPPDSSRWLPFFLPIYALLGLLGTRPKFPLWLTTGLQAAFGAGFAWLTLSPMREQGWSMTSLMLTMTGFGLALALYTALLEQTAERTDSGWLGLSLLAVISGGSGVLFLQASTAVFMQQVWMLALLLCLPTGLLLWRKELSPRGLLTLPTFILTGLWLNGLLFSSAAKWWPLILLSGFSPWLLKTKVLSQKPEKLRQSLVLLLTSLTLAALLAVIWFSQPDPSLYWG